MHLGGIVGTSGLNVDLAVERALSARVAALDGAVKRLRAAVAGNADETAGEVHAALAEAINWLASIAGRSPLAGDHDVQALLFVRNRVQHQFASATTNDGTGWRRRPVGSLPTNPERRDKFRRPLYEQRLAGTPLLDVFDRLKLATT